MRIQQSGILCCKNTNIYSGVTRSSFKRILQPLLKWGIKSISLNKNTPEKKFCLNDLINFVMSKLSKRKDIKVSEVKQVLIAALFSGLQNEEDFYRDIAEGSIKGRYIMPHIKNNAEVISELKSKGVIEAQRAYESPRFNNGILTNNAYDDIMTRIKGAPSWKLNDAEKKELINKLAKSNNHQEDIITGNISFGGESNTDLSDISDNHDGSLWDAFLDLLDDIF